LVATRVRYGEGDWFAVPLDEGGFCVGVVARANRSGVLLGYFFGPKRLDVPTLAELTALKAGDAVLVGAFRPTFANTISRSCSRLAKSRP
jgi:hypothetical protein